MRLGVVVLVLTLLAAAVSRLGGLGYCRAQLTAAARATAQLALVGTLIAEALIERRGEVEAGLAIGLLERDARWLVAREAAGLALVPGLDQTRTIGLVTLPGAFVGMLLGGARPLQAAAVQLVVLVALLLVAAVAAVLTLELVARRLLA